MIDVEELWEALSKYEIRRSYVFRKVFISIPEEDFKRFEPYFTRQNVVAWNNFENLRSVHWFVHVHAVRQKAGEVNIHLDRCNPNTHWLLNIPHGFFDVMPYLVWCLIKRKVPFRV